MSLKFIDLFAGLGGFHLALSDLGHECVFASEINPELRDIYRGNFSMSPEGDIWQVSPRQIPAHDVLCAGFPCQPFSKAGYQRGLDETRGTLFGKIIDIIAFHKPRYLILENVGNFEQHDKGNTWRMVKSSLIRLGYYVAATEHKKSGGPGLLSPHHLGFPHHRERFFIVASRNSLGRFSFPGRDTEHKTCMVGVVEDELSPRDQEETKITQKQIDCIDHWNQLLGCLPDNILPNLPSFPIWGDELWSNYPYAETTPLLLSYKDLAKSVNIPDQDKSGKQTRDELLLQLPAYATRSKVFPPWKIRFIAQNRDWFNSIRHHIPSGWEKRLKDFPPSLRKLEWNCKGETRNLWEHILQFRSSGLRVKRYQNCPSLVAMTSTQIPILGPKRRFLSRGEGLQLQGFPADFVGPQARTDTFHALGNAVHVGVVRAIAEKLL